jgi:RNA polymerase sigma-70 factor, ECF subfamily
VGASPVTAPGFVRDCGGHLPSEVSARLRVTESPGDTPIDMDTAEIQGAWTVPFAALSDVEVVRRVRAGESELFEILMRRHNQRVYRAARAILKDEAEVEDVMQQAYINAFTHLHQFEERSQFSTWLTRITLNEAFGRRRKTQRTESLTTTAFRVGDEGGAFMREPTSPDANPEQQAYAGELRGVLEETIDRLPETYRTVFMLRDVEGLSTSETAEGLALGEATVKTRLHRARAIIRRLLTARVGELAVDAFPFHATRCDRVVASVLSAIAAC